MRRPLFSITMTLANLLVRSTDDWDWRNGGPPEQYPIESQADWNAETVSMLASDAIGRMAWEVLFEEVRK